MFEASPPPSAQAAAADRMRRPPGRSRQTAMTPTRRSPRRSRTPPGHWSRSSCRPIRRGEWKIAYARAGGPAEVEVTDATGAVKAPRPPRPETNARLMRRLHDGTGMGLIWQIVIFIGGIIPAALAVTGLVMWWRSRGWKAALAKKRKARALTPQPAE